MDKIYFCYKIEKFFYKIKLIPFAFIMRAIIRIIFSCDIPYKATIGKGTTFPHDALGIVIHPDTVIGENCKILQGVTIGGRSSFKEVPKIGNNVLIGANAIIIGPITIGDNVKIGAGAIVTKSIPCNATVCGNEAQIIKTDKEREKI